MNRVCKLLSLMFLAALMPLAAHATCSVATPCVALTWQNTTIASTVTTNTAGEETSGPGTAAVYKCLGTVSVCSSTSLNASGCSSGTCSAGSPWSVVSNTISQTTVAGAFTDPNVAYSQTVNYAVTNTWSGTLGGDPSGYSAIFQMAISSAPAAAPAAPGTPSGVLVTTGS